VLGDHQFGVDLDHQHVFEIGAVVDADPASLGQSTSVTPQEIMLHLLGRRFLEREDLAALRVDAGHHVLDGAVLAGGVHGLEDQQDGMRIGGVELFLRYAQGVQVFGQQLLGELFAIRLGRLLVAGPRGIVVLEAHFLAGPHAHGVEDVVE
jgi:hypothetical protein